MKYLKFIVTDQNQNHINTILYNPNIGYKYEKNPPTTPTIYIKCYLEKYHNNPYINKIIYKKQTYHIQTKIE